MPARTIPERFLVAFSLAGEQRDLVRPIAEAVEKLLGETNVFYDEWFEHYIAGQDADLKLQRIYGERCALAVVCVSERYGGKPWTKTEHAAIRARQMQAQESHDQLGILPIRVGDGDVEGILFNAIVPDVRRKSVDEAAQLIVDRLRLILPDLSADELPGSDWPDEPPLLNWPMADHVEAREAFRRLLSREASFRFLPIRGPSEVGKTHITKQMRYNALRMTDLAVGRFDLKGATGMANELQAFAGHLEIGAPPVDLPLSQRLSRILDALKQRARPTLLVFDTYESGFEAQDWVESQLLPTLIRAAWLRVVVVGQRVPAHAGAMLGAVSSPLIELQPPSPKEWFDFGKQHKPDITEEFVLQAYQLCGGKAGVLAALVGPSR